VIIGRSLGSGLAVRLACDVDAAMVVLVTPFVSLTAVAQRIYPFVPEWLLKYRLRTDTIAHEVKAPVLLIHGTHDELLPLEDSRALLAGFRTRKELIVIEGASHNDIHQFDAYRDGLAQRLVRLADEAGTARQRSQ
jgi:alpha-beta hydrolase superfamily lysophospholipase